MRPPEIVGVEDVGVYLKENILPLLFAEKIQNEILKRIEKNNKYKIEIEAFCALAYNWLDLSPEKLKNPALKNDPIISFLKRNIINLHFISTSDATDLAIRKHPGFLFRLSTTKKGHITLTYSRENDQVENARFKLFNRFSSLETNDEKKEMINKCHNVISPRALLTFLGFLKNTEGLNLIKDVFIDQIYCPLHLNLRKDRQAFFHYYGQEVYSKNLKDGGKYKFISGEIFPHIPLEYVSMYLNSENIQ